MTVKYMTLEPFQPLIEQGLSADTEFHRVDFAVVVGAEETPDGTVRRIDDRVVRGVVEFDADLPGVVGIDLHIGEIGHPGRAAEGAVDRDVDVQAAVLRAQGEVVEIDAEVVVVALFPGVESDQVAGIVDAISEVVASPDGCTGPIERPAVRVGPVLNSS
jgi:hypothetical protein